MLYEEGYEKDIRKYLNILAAIFWYMSGIWTIMPELDEIDSNGFWAQFFIDLIFNFRLAHSTFNQSSYICFLPSVEVYESLKTL